MPPLRTSVKSVFWFGTISYCISRSRGGPRQYRGLAVRSSNAPGCHDFTTNGPLPMGWMLNAAWLKSATDARRCLGSIDPTTPLCMNVDTNGADGSLRCTTTVYGSGVCSDATSSYCVRYGRLLRGFMIWSKV